MSLRLLVSLLILGVGVVCAEDLPTLDVSGFSWAENQAFDNNNNLFVTDTTQGKIYRIYLDEQQNKYVKTLHLEGFSIANGIVFNSEDDILYAAVSYKGTPVLISFSSDVPNDFTVLSEMAAAGNGLAWDPIRRVVYATNEGKFVPGQGFIMQVNPDNNSSSVIVSGLDSADGCQILNGDFLYITEVLTATFKVFNISDPTNLKQVCTFKAPSGVYSVDDFSFSDDGSLIFGADYRNGTVVSFTNNCLSPNSNSPLTYIMTGLTDPTSVYLAPPNSQKFSTTALFVSEGGSLVATLHNRHVLQSPPVKRQ